MKKKCSKCQYYQKRNDVVFAQGEWCSNSESTYSRGYVHPVDGCDQFYKRGKKAPLWMRIAKKVLK